MYKENTQWVSHETIYNHIYNDFQCGGSLFTNLRFSHRSRRPRFPRRNKDRRRLLKDTLSIELRPPGANNRTRLAHWERDTMYRRNSLLVMVDRKSRIIKLGKLRQRTGELTLAATKKLLRRQPKKSMTNDRGREFSDHKNLTKQLGLPVYFCHPYTSSERGSVENRIGCIRQYFPKGTDLKYVKHKTIKRIEQEMNNRPMKCLDWRTPYEYVSGENVALTT